MNICVGKVISVRGIKILIQANNISSHDILFHDGETFDGVSIKGYLLIRRGFRDIVGKIEGEYLEENHLEKIEGDKEIDFLYLRKIEIRPIGYFEKGTFYEGVKYLPMINDKAYLASDTHISCVINPIKEENNKFIIGTAINENLPVYLPWQHLFNTHIGVFGNTGSGKSNTLTKLYTELFAIKSNQIRGKSKFVIIDFNGEYTNNQILPQNEKEVINLNTHDNNGDMIILTSKQFWDAETLSLLFKATDNTQKPFIKRIINNREYFQKDKNSLENYFKATFKKVFTSTAQKKDVVNLFIDILENLEKLTNISKYNNIIENLRKLSWHSTNQYFYSGSLYFNGGENDKAYKNIFEEHIENFNLPKNYGFDTELKLRINLQLINDLQGGYAQFDHIQPLLKRAESFLVSIKKVIEVTDTDRESTSSLRVISLRNCNQEIKKIIPLLLAKQLYETHKKTIIHSNKPIETLHLIIDEAHNILSSQSIREQESWKDYRLELFEEIIKEGRKFGVFLTLSSQRPADISPTIISQLHNFFIHRLVNDKDLSLLDSTINTLDKLSKDRISHLAKGCCVITGTTFDMPLIVQIDLLPNNKQPDSEDVNLAKLWE